MQTRMRPWNILAKGMALFLALELTFGLLQPDASALNVYRTAAMKRSRFPISTHAPEDAALDVGNLNEMFASHIVSEPKAPAEYRIFVLGDSAIWGDLLPPDQTLTAQLNALRLTCGGRQVRFYDLSFPQSSATKDLLILNAGLRYQPDMVLWALTLYTLMPKTRTDHWLIRQNLGDLYALDERYPFLPKGYPRPTPWGRFQAQQTSLFQVVRYDLFGLVPAATGEDQMNPQQPEVVPLALSRDLNFQGMAPPTLRPRQISIDEVQIAYQLAQGRPILLFNEPMLIEANVANSDVQYNGYYPRWVYDQYRQILGAAAAQNHWNYLDLWNSVAASYFTNTPLHMNAAGEALLARSLGPEIGKACG